jgi:hypothetical protein
MLRRIIRLGYFSFSPCFIEKVCNSAQTAKRGGVKNLCNQFCSVGQPAGSFLREVVFCGLLWFLREQRGHRPQASMIKRTKAIFGYRSKLSPTPHFKALSAARHRPQPAPGERLPQALICEARISTWAPQASWHRLCLRLASLNQDSH